MFRFRCKLCSLSLCRWRYYIQPLSCILFFLWLQLQLGMSIVNGIFTTLTHTHTLILPLSNTSFDVDETVFCCPFVLSLHQNVRLRIEEFRVGRLNIELPAFTTLLFEYMFIYMCASTYIYIMMYACVFYQNK